VSNQSHSANIDKQKSREKKGRYSIPNPKTCVENIRRGVITRRSASCRGGGRVHSNSRDGAGRQNATDIGEVAIEKSESGYIGPERGIYLSSWSRIGTAGRRRGWKSIGECIENRPRKRSDYGAGTVKKKISKNMDKVVGYPKRRRKKTIWGGRFQRKMTRLAKGRTKIHEKTTRMVTNRTSAPKTDGSCRPGLKAKKRKNDYLLDREVEASSTGGGVGGKRLSSTVNKTGVSHRHVKGTKRRGIGKQP